VGAGPAWGAPGFRGRCPADGLLAIRGNVARGLAATRSRAVTA
jgi:hypothetical protein